MVETTRQIQKQGIPKYSLLRALALMKAPFSWPEKYTEDEHLLAVSCGPSKTETSNPMRTQKIGRNSYRFPLPEGWKYSEYESDIYLAATSIPAWMIIVPHEHDCIEKLNLHLQPECSSREIKLKRQNSVEMLDDSIISVNLSGVITDVPVRAISIGTISPYGVGVHIITITKYDLFKQDENFEIAKLAAENIASQMEYLQRDCIEIKEYLSGLFENQKGDRFILLNDSTFGRRFKGVFTGYTRTLNGERVRSLGMSRWNAVWGKWTVTGEKSQGEIVVDYSDSSREIITFRVIGEKNERAFEIDLNGNLYTRQKAIGSAKSM